MIKIYTMELYEESRTKISTRLNQYINKILIEDRFQVKLNKMKNFSKFVSEKHLESYKSTKIEIKKFDFLFTFLNGWCKSIVIEYGYYDTEFLSSYYAYYAKKFKFVNKKSFRLLLLDDLNNLIGFIILNPFADIYRIGRYGFNLQYLIKEKCLVMTHNQKIHFLEQEFNLKCFVQMGPQPGFAVCAQSSIWGLLNYCNLRFGVYAKNTIADISLSARENYQRPFPTEGLTLEQMSNVVMQKGYFPIISHKHEAEFKYCDDLVSSTLIDEIISYLYSSIPVIARIGYESHAVLLTGVISNQETMDERYGMLIEENPNKKFILYSDLIDSMIVNDYNNLVPLKIGRKKKNRESIKFDDYNNKTFDSIDDIIVPLYQRVHLTYRDIVDTINSTLKVDKTAFNVYFKTKNSPLIIKIQLVSINTFKQYISEINNFYESYKKIIYHLEMSKYVWLVELGYYEFIRQNQVNGFILFDSTNFFIENNDCLLQFDGKKIMIYDNHEMIDITDKKARGIKSFKMFNKNLEEVESSCH